MKESDEKKVKDRLRALGYLDEVSCLVSGLERSGTSLMMQILEAGDVPVEYSAFRKPDIDNKNGYYELFDGKIISKLMNKEVDLNHYKGKYIKITSFGLFFLPEDDYNIIFMERDLKEIVDSMDKKMTKKFNKRETYDVQKILLKSVKELIKLKKWNVLYVNYNNLLRAPDVELKKIKRFIGYFDMDKAKTAIDDQLYHNRR